MSARRLVQAGVAGTGALLALAGLPAATAAAGTSVSVPCTNQAALVAAVKAANAAGGVMMTGGTSVGEGQWQENK